MRINVFNYILMLLLGVVICFMGNDIEVYNYIFVSIYALLFVINLLDFNNKNKKILCLLFLWLCIFNYIYYYESLFQLFIVVSLSIYLLIINNLLIKEKINKVVYFVTNIFPFIVLIRPLFNLRIYFVILGVYLILYNLYLLCLYFRKK